MTEYRRMPDVEEALIAGLNAVLEFPVSSELPKSFKGEKHLTIVRNGGGSLDPNSEAFWRPTLQFDGYGKTKKQAFTVIADAQLVAKTLIGITVNSVFISSLDTLTGPQWLPDPDTDIPRYFGTFVVVARSA